MTSRSLLAIAAMLLFAACSSGAGASPPPTVVPATMPRTDQRVSPEPSVAPAALTIFGAASLKGALEEAKSAYEAANPGTTITLATDSSAALETQIEQGAPADVFLSADTTNPKKLVDAGFAAREPVNFAGNGLTIIVPKGNPGGLSAPEDLAKAGLKVIAAGDEVPITKYATQLIANLAGQAGAPAGFEAAYAANVASKEDNVKAVVGKIELGEGDAAIVYVTDANASDVVEPVELPDAANVPATYAGVVVEASPNQAAAGAFLDWLASAEGQKILATFGFLPPPS